MLSVYLESTMENISITCPHLRPVGGVGSLARSRPQSTTSTNVPFSSKAAEMRVGQSPSLAAILHIIFFRHVNDEVKP
jgi:hypothetical protein